MVVSEYWSLSTAEADRSGGRITDYISVMRGSKKGDVSVLVSSKHSKEKLKTLLAKPKDLWIFHCCGFQVLDSYFNRWQIQEVKGSHFQYSNDKKNWKDYSPG